MQLSQIFKQSSIEAAPLLLGCYISRQTAGGRVKLMIVETEAYRQDDPASHSFRGITPRSAPMFESGGRLYVYFTYGMHYCVNIVTGPKGVGEAVLLRAAQPLEGIEIMRYNRRVNALKQLASGPAKLAQALGIKDTSLSGKILNPAPFAGASAIRLPTAPARKKYGASKYADILLEPSDHTLEPNQIIAGPRVGISHAVDAPMRFYIKDNPWVSKL